MITMNTGIIKIIGINTSVGSVAITSADNDKNNYDYDNDMIMMMVMMIVMLVMLLKMI